MHPRVQLEKLMAKFEHCSDHLDDDAERFGWRINDLFFLIEQLARCIDKLEEQIRENKSS